MNFRPRKVSEEEFKVYEERVSKVAQPGARASLAGVRSTFDSVAPGPTGKPCSPYLPRELVVVGQIHSGKNRILITRTGKHIPTLRFQLWRDEVIYDLVQQWKQPAITTPIRLHCLYWPSDRRTRDVSGMEDALFHVLVKAGVLEDDGLIYDCLWYRQPMNKKGAKVLMTLTEWAS